MTRNGHMRKSDFDLYKRSRYSFSAELFENPTSEYRGCPLWAWNSQLHKPLLRKEIRALKDMGIGGFTMHSRVGLDTEYLGDEFMDCVAACVSEAKKLDMKAYLYDEDRWPSGASGGLLTKNDPSLRMLHLLFTPWKYGTPGHGPDGNISTGGAAFRGENGYLLGRYAITLNKSGLMTYRHLSLDDEGENGIIETRPGEKIWYAYVESAPKSSWFNDAWYLDTMSQKAVSAFIASTHEKYKAARGVGDEFGKTIVAVFTDEPQFAGMTQLSQAHDERDIFGPWTEGLQHSFRDATGIDLVATLPELIWDRQHVFPDMQIQPSLTRYKYFDHVAELFTSSFLDQLSEWCEAHSLGQMGHMMEEPTLLQQTQCLGEAMRTYRSMQIPGVDMLVDSREYNTVKQCSSVARQYGRTACMSELYGVTNWTYSFKDYKGQGDWQAALGVTLRAHHLSWVSMNGEGKRDYPAQIGYQSPWYKKFSFIESHFARVVVAMSRGRARTRVAVVHPIESFWLRYGCKQTSPEQGPRDQWFGQLTNWLIFGMIDFDFLSESLLPELVSEVKNPLAVGHARYDVVVLPHLLTVRSSTMAILEKFTAAGGQVIITGGDPGLVDAMPSSRCRRSECTRINFQQSSILQELQRYRDVDITTKVGGLRTENLLYQWRDDRDDQAFVFITNTDRDRAVNTTVTLGECWAATVLDTITGKSWRLRTTIRHQTTTFDWNFEGCASLLLHLQRKKAVVHSALRAATDLCCTEGHSSLHLITGEETRDQSLPLWSVVKLLQRPIASRLTEPNSLLIDFCRYKIDDQESWSELDEILRIDNQVRGKLGMRPRGDAMAQPWVTPRPRAKPKHVVYLQYHFSTTTTLPSIELALEGAAITRIQLDGRQVPILNYYEWWVDESITRVPLPEVAVGIHELMLEIPFDELNTCMERIYLLGEFDVSLDQSLPKSKMTSVQRSTWLKDDPPHEFGDYTLQGLPFYTGNVIYSFEIKGNGKLTALRFPELGINPVLAIRLNEELLGDVALPPYIMVLGRLKSGVTYHVDVEVFGNRDHSFGAVHGNGELGVYGPTAWRTSGDQWTDGYFIRNMGLLSGVEILEELKNARTTTCGSVTTDLRTDDGDQTEEHLVKQDVTQSRALTVVDPATIEQNLSAPVFIAEVADTDDAGEISEARKLETATTFHGNAHSCSGISAGTKVTSPYLGTSAIRGETSAQSVVAKPLAEVTSIPSPASPHQLDEENDSDDDHGHHFIARQNSVSSPSLAVRESDDDHDRVMFLDGAHERGGDCSCRDFARNSVVFSDGLIERGGDCFSWEHHESPYNSLEVEENRLIESDFDDCEQHIEYASRVAQTPESRSILSGDVPREIILAESLDERSNCCYTEHHENPYENDEDEDHDNFEGFDEEYTEYAQTESAIEVPEDAHDECEDYDDSRSPDLNSEVAQSADHVELEDPKIGSHDDAYDESTEYQDEEYNSVTEHHDDVYDQSTEYQDDVNDNSTAYQDEEYNSVTEQHDDVYDQATEYQDDVHDDPEIYHDDMCLATTEHLDTEENQGYFVGHSEIDIIAHSEPDIETLDDIHDDTVHAHHESYETEEHESSPHIELDAGVDHDDGADYAGLDDDVALEYYCDACDGADPDCYFAHYHEAGDSW